MRVAEKLLLIGPNRRSQQTIIEQQLLPGERELNGLAAAVFPRPHLGGPAFPPGLGGSDEQ